MASPVIDVHTHVLTEAWFQLLQAHGAPRYSVKPVVGGLRAIHLEQRSSCDEQRQRPYEP